MHDIITTYRMPRTTTRTSARHRVELPCEVITADADEPALLWATDLSASGLWLDTEDLRSLGDEMVVCFKPSVWWKAREIQVFAKVARVSPGKRGPSDERGMGLSFMDLTRHEKWQLRCWLRPRPEKAPTRRKHPRFAVPAAAPSPLRSASPFASRIC